MQLPGGSTKGGSPMKLSNPCSGQRLRPLRTPPFPGLPLSRRSAFLSLLRPPFPQDLLRLYRPEDAPCTSARMLSMRRAQPSCKGLSPLSRCPEVNHGATGRIDRRFNGSERCSSRRGSWLLPGGGFCLTRPAKSAPWSLLVNRFAVLDVEEVNTEVCEPIDAPSLSPSAPVGTALPRRPKWEKRLPKRLSANTLDARRTSIILPIEIGTTDTSEV